MSTKLEKPKLRLVTVCGENIDMLPHFIFHYKKLGVEHFHIVLHVYESDTVLQKEVHKILESNNLELDHIYMGSWNGKINTDIMNGIMKKYPEDWFIVADQDELQTYPKPIKKIIDDCEFEEKNFVTGCFLDRISINGRLKPVTEELIWKQFPLAGFISFPLAYASPYKITLCKGKIRLLTGQHAVEHIDYKFGIRNEIISQVHHFKWTESLAKKFKYRLEAKSRGEWEESYMPYEDEINRILDYLAKHNNSFNIKEPIFLLEQSDTGEYGHSKWNYIKEFLTSWKDLQKYPKIQN